MDRIEDTIDKQEEERFNVMKREADEDLSNAYVSLDKVPDRGRIHEKATAMQKLEEARFWLSKITW